MLFTWNGIMNMRNSKWSDDFSPIDPEGASFVDRTYSKAYLHHLFIAKEMFAAMIASEHNLAFYLDLVRAAREHIVAGGLRLVEGSDRKENQFKTLGTWATD